MVTYSARGLEHTILPRHNSGLIAKFIQLENGKGRELYEQSEPLTVNEVRGPSNISAGDMVVICDFVHDIPIYFLCKYLKGI